MYWLKRLSALKEAIFCCLFKQKVSSYCPRVLSWVAAGMTDIPERAARGGKPWGLDRGGGGFPVQPLCFWHYAHQHEIQDKEQAEALVKRL